MSLAFQHAFSRMVLLLFSFGMQDYGFWRFWNNTESNSTSEGRGEAKQNNCEGQTVPLAIQHVFLGSGFIVFLSFGMRNFVPRLSPKNILQKFTYWYTMLYTTQISFAWANKHSASAKGVSLCIPFDRNIVSTKGSPHRRDFRGYVCK